MAYPTPSAPPKDADLLASSASESASFADREIALGTYRPLWADMVAERNPALRFLAPDQQLELSPADAERLGVAAGQEVQVRSNGTSVRARVALRSRMREGAAFLAEGTSEENANRLAGAPVVEVTPS
jgi:NADH-quinone oxidoreductase subunit G